MAEWLAHQWGVHTILHTLLMTNDDNIARQAAAEAARLQRENQRIAEAAKLAEAAEAARIAEESTRKALAAAEAIKRKNAENNN